jgi:predicted PurR-regulated permease PerM
LPKIVALVALSLSILLPIAAFLTFFGAVIAGQVSGLVSEIPEAWNRVSTFVEEQWPQVIDFFEHHPIGQKIQESFQGQGEAVVGGLQYLGGKALSAGRGVLSAVGSILSWAVLPVYFAFFVMAERKEVGRLEDALPFLKPETRKDAVFLAQEFVTIIVAFFRGQLLIAAIQGALMAIGFSLVGLKYGLVLGFVLGFLNIIPYLGSIVGLGVTLPIAWFQAGGGPATFAGVLAVFAIVQAIEGYVLTPKIMGDRTGLHPVAIIVAVFFWGSALQGILGMILAIPLTAFLVVFWRLAREKYIGELV